jgi:hypothetical protein
MHATLHTPLRSDRARKEAKLDCALWLDWADREGRSDEVAKGEEDEEGPTSATDGAWNEYHCVLFDTTAPVVEDKSW